MYVTTPDKLFSIIQHKIIKYFCRLFVCQHVLPGNKMAVCLSSLIFFGFPVKFHWPLSCQSNLSPDATERSILNSDTLKTYNSLILPCINYCCQVWGNTSKYLIKKVVILQKRVIRIICKCNYKGHRGPLLKKCKLLKLKVIVDFSGGIIYRNQNWLPGL